MAVSITSRSASLGDANGVIEAAIYLDCGNALEGDLYEQGYKRMTEFEGDGFSHTTAVKQ